MVNKVNLKESRHKLPILIVTRKGSESSKLRQLLLNIGFNEIFTASSYLNALQEAKERPVSMVLYESDPKEGEQVTPIQFIEYIKKLARNPVLIALSYEPSGEEIFSLLQAGTHSFLLQPFTSGALEEVFNQVQEGFTISQDVLHAEDRNAAFADLIQDQLDSLCGFIKSAAGREDLTEHVEARSSAFETLVKTAIFFSEGDISNFKEALHTGFEERAKLIDARANASRLQKTRDKLRKAREKKK